MLIRHNLKSLTQSNSYHITILARVVSRICSTSEETCSIPYLLMVHNLYYLIGHEYMCVPILPYSGKFHDGKYSFVSNKPIFVCSIFVLASSEN